MVSLRYLFTACAALVLVACGGGGSPDAVTDPSPAASVVGATASKGALPTASTDPDRPSVGGEPIAFGNPGETLNLSLQASFADGAGPGPLYVQIGDTLYELAPSNAKAEARTVSVGLALSADTTDPEICLGVALADAQGRVSSPNQVCVGLPANAPPGTPVANAGPDLEAVGGRVVFIDGAAAVPTGQLVAIAWSQIDGPLADIDDDGQGGLTLSAPAVSANAELVLRLSATSDTGQTDTDEVSVRLRPADAGNQPPLAEAGEDQVVDEGVDVSLSGSGSDADGQVTALAWQQIDGPAVELRDPATSAPSFEAPLVGADTALVFQLTVADDDGATGTDTVTVTVRDVPPVTDADGDGVDDADDQCPETPTGEAVDPQGCSDSQKDSDGDGVTDDADQCADTPDGDPANELGCGLTQVDSDDDGVADAFDQCPEEGPAGEGQVIGADGCAFVPSRAGAASVDATWHFGSSAGQFSETGHGIDGNRGYDPYMHSTRKVGSDTLGSNIHTRALVVEGGNGKRVAVVANDLYLPNDLTRRRVAQLLREYDIAATGDGALSPALAALGLPAPTQPLGIDEANLAMTVSHSHTSPFYSTPSPGPWIFQDVYDIRFHEYIATQMFRAIVEAAADMREVSVAGTAVYANDIRSHTYGAKVSDESSTLNTPAGQPHDYTTRQMYVLSFDNLADGSNYANWIVLGIHPEWVWGEEVINGDVTHATMRLLDRETGALTIMSQSETGASGPHKDLRAHDPEERREFQESSFAGADRAARLVADGVHRALGRIDGNDPWDPAQFAPRQAAFDVDFAYQRFAPPVTRPVPGVSNCNADRLYAEANPNLVAADELPECKSAAEQAEPITEPFEAAFGVNPVTTITDAAAQVTAPLFEQLASMGVPLPQSVSTPSLVLLEEQATVPIQAFKLGDIALTFCPCEQFTDPALNVISRLDRVAGNIHTGWDWDIGYAGDNPLRDPAANGDFVHGIGEIGCEVGAEEVICPTPNREDDPSNTLTMTRAAYDRMKAQIHSDADGWEELANALHAESEPQDVSQIWGNFTHEEHTEHGYAMVVPVGMANDYWGYMPAYREYRSHDHYRKSLAGLGPHGADFLATRMSRLAAQLNGGEGMAPSPKDQAYLAEDGRAEAFTRGLGELGRAINAAYPLTLPADGGSPGIIVQPESIERFDAASVQWIGGSTWLGMPQVRVERCTASAADDCTAWETYAEQDGEVQLHVQFLAARTEFAEQGAPAVVPDPADYAAWRGGQFEWVWTAAFEAFVSELPIPSAAEHARPMQPHVTPTGQYRFVIEGQRHTGAGQTEAYMLESRPFAVRPWTGLIAGEPQGSGSAVEFAIGPETSFTVYQNGADTRRPFSDGIKRTIGPVNYPDTWKSVRDGGSGAIPWIRDERNLHRYRGGSADDQLYCHRCTFRPWLEQGTVESIAVTHEAADGSLSRGSAASIDERRWSVVPAGVASFIEPGAMQDAYGNTNALCFDLVGSACDADGDGVQRHLDLCADTPAGAPVDADGCALPDADGDGVSDASDQCPGTAPGAIVDAQGCAAEQIDSDGDGVHDAADQCPGTPAGETADADGCSESQRGGGADDGRPRTGASLVEYCYAAAGDNAFCQGFDEQTAGVADQCRDGGDVSGGAFSADDAENFCRAFLRGDLDAALALCDSAAGAMPAICSPVASLADVLATRNPWLPRRPLNISHRGGADQFPENTLFAYAESLKAGSDMIEADVYRTSDGEIVVIHDATVNRTTDGSGSVNQMTLAQIKALDAAYCHTRVGSYELGDRFSASCGASDNDEDFPYRGIATGSKAPPLGYTEDDFRIPTLRELLARFPDTLINLELKPDERGAGQYEGELAEILAEYGRSEDVIVASFLDSAALAFKAQAPLVSTSVPTVQVALSIASGSGPSPGVTIGHEAFQVPPVFSGVEVINAEFIADAHAQGLAVHAWTIDNCDEMVDLLDLGVDGIMTDRPSLLSRVIDDRASKPRSEWICQGTLQPPEPSEPIGCTADNSAAAGYRHFIGTVHEHSGYSDGAVGTTPADYYAAGDAVGLDFVAGSEHSDNAYLPVTANQDCLSEDFPDCFTPPPEGVQKWNDTAAMAAAATRPGFTAIRGFEWTSDRFGHINVFFSANDLNAKTSTGYALSMEDFWQWLGAPSTSFNGIGGGDDGLAVFNHPGREDDVHANSPVGDPAYAWNLLEYRPEHDGRVVGMEAFGKGSDYYDSNNDAPPGGWYAFALDRGWHVGPVGAEDHHGTEWALPKFAKTVMIAAENSPAGLREAMRARRFYAVAHHFNGLRLHFAANGLPMGSRIGVPAGQTLSFEVSVTGLSSPVIEVVGPGGVVIESHAGTIHTFDVAVDSAAEAWRFVRIKQGEQVVAVSAPIWFRAGEAWPICPPDETPADPPPMDGPTRASLVGCALSRDGEQCQAALESLGGLSDCPPSEAGFNCGFNTFYDAIGVDHAAYFLSDLLAACGDFPSAAVCEAVRTSGGGSIPDRFPLIDEVAPRGTLAVSSDAHTGTGGDRLIDGDPADWVGTATRIGGTSTWSNGEHIYSDYLFDGRGADNGDDVRRLAVALLLAQGNSRFERADQLFQAAGEQFGAPPPAGANDFYGDAADNEPGMDLSEVRWASGDGQSLDLLVRATRLTSADQLKVLVLADTDPDAAGMASLNAGLRTRRFDRAVLLDNGSATAIDLGSGDLLALAAPAWNADGMNNAVEARIPASALVGGDGVLRVAVMTVRGDCLGFEGCEVINLAYRDAEPVAGIYNDRGQALSLFDGNIDAYTAEIAIGDLSGGRHQVVHPAYGYHERQFISGDNISVVDGSEDHNPWQRYGLFVPSGYDPASASPMTFWLHYRGGKVHSGAAWTPRLLPQLGEEHGNIVVTPHGRSTSRWYVTRSHQDVWEVFADVAGTAVSGNENLAWGDGYQAAGLMNVDASRVYLSGYSMGGYGTYLFGLLYPDRFAGGYSTSGALTQGAWTGIGPNPSDPGGDLCSDEFTVPEGTPEAGGGTACFIEANSGRANAQLNYRILDNARHLPLVIHHGTDDELVPTTGVQRFATRLHELGYRYDYQSFIGFEHYTQAIVDEWRDGAFYLNRHARPENPRTVTYKLVPALVAALNEVNAGDAPDPNFRFRPDGAWWVDGIVHRDGEVADPGVFARVEATSHALAGDEVIGVPRAADSSLATDPGSMDPWISTPLFSPLGHSTPYVRQGQDWQATGAAEIANGFELTLVNVDQVSLDAARMGLSFGVEDASGSIDSDGPATVGLTGLPVGTTACIDGNGVGVSDDLGRIELAIGAGSSALRLLANGASDCGGAPPVESGASAYPGAAEVCAAYGLPDAPACDGIATAHAEMFEACMAEFDDAAFCSATGGNLHALVSRCYTEAGSDARPLCKVVDTFVSGFAAYCRQVGENLGGVEPEACALIGGVRISQRALAAYEAGPTLKALTAQYELMADAPMRDWLIPATHNSYNATDANTPPTLSGSDSNQHYRLVDQLRMGIRAVEIDVHWMPSPTDGEFRPTVCHATGPSFGCSTERALRTELLELRAWLDANPDQVIILDLENNIGASPEPFSGADRNAVMNGIFVEVLGDRLYTPADHGASCSAGQPLDATINGIRAAGDQVLMYAGGCSGLGDLLFSKSATHVQHGSGSYLGMSYPDDCRFTAAELADKWTRLYEDGTMVGALAGGTSRLSNAAEVREMVRCGVNMPSLDHIHPDDDRMPALVWSWAEGEPAAGLDCTVLGADGRLAAASCEGSRAHACRTGLGGWQLSAGGASADGATACGSAAYAPPVNGRDMEALNAVANGQVVWVNAPR